MEIIKEAYEDAIEVLRKCSTNHGFFAAYPGYDAVWSRDSMITSLGASLVEDEFKKDFERSLSTLAKEQSAKGQIPNAVDKFSKRRARVDYLTIDSSMWFIIGHYIYKKRFGDGALFRKQKKNIDAALTWLSYQDTSEDGMLDQLPTTDWQDAFPHRYGHTINTQALYYKVLNLIGDKAGARRLKGTVESGEGLWNGEFYLPWRWKNHNKYAEKGDWFDSLGNLLAIVFGLADKKKAEKILDYVKDKKVDKPYPVKSISPVIRKGSKDWRDYFLDSEAGTPYHYSNGGIWTYIGGFYVLALIKAGRVKEARGQLARLAHGNLDDNFNFGEWRNGKTGKPGSAHARSQEGNQAWNAGMYILAYESLKEGRVLI
jgi:glycogen debranching enzyme